jgi:hypothetical protein
MAKSARLPGTTRVEMRLREGPPKQYGFHSCFPCLEALLEDNLLLFLVSPKFDLLNNNPRHHRFL